MLTLAPNDDWSSRLTLGLEPQSMTSGLVFGIGQSTTLHEVVQVYGLPREHVRDDWHGSRLLQDQSDGTIIQTHQEMDQEERVPNSRLALAYKPVPLVDD